MTATNDDRARVAQALREMETPTWPTLTEAVMGHAATRDKVVERLADLIEPTDGFDLDTVQRVCFECMEGCDEPEWTLYTTVYEAIARYKRGESGPTYDRDALLALAEEIEDNDLTYCVSTQYVLDSYARRIREALGVGR